MTHTFSYLSLTQPGLSLDLHSFDYSSLSRLCPFLLSPPHSLCNYSIFTYDALSLELLLSHGHSSIYSVVAVCCKLLSFDILGNPLPFSLQEALQPSWIFSSKKTHCNTVFSPPLCSDLGIPASS